MMNSRVKLFGVLTVAILSGGCGTVANTVGCDLDTPIRELPLPGNYDWQGGPIGPLWHRSGDCQEYAKQVYGGVREDLTIWGVGQTTLPHFGNDPWLAVLDLPFSAIGDTLTLPYILAYRNGLFGSIKEQPAGEP
jgi:uncharacterized protein YceK